MGYVSELEPWWLDDGEDAYAVAAVPPLRAALEVSAPVHGERCRSCHGSTFWCRQDVTSQSWACTSCYPPVRPPGRLLIVNTLAIAEIA